MKKSWGLTDKILTGEKKIESRWYSSKRAPLDRLNTGDTVYFKNSGELVTIKAEVSKVLQFENLTPQKIKEILDQYRKDDGIEEIEIPRFYELFKDKRYCILVFLKNPQRIEPFDIDKTGFGAMAAWITISDIKEIIKH